MTLISLVYVSFATNPLTNEELLDLLVEAREKNKSLYVTGMLLYRHGLFIQALEGEESVVLRLYKRIKQDERHHSVREVYRNKIEDRTFADWSMGFNKFDTDALQDIEGFSNFLVSPLPNFFADNPTYVKKLLYTFREQSTL